MDRHQSSLTSSFFRIQFLDVIQGSVEGEQSHRVHEIHQRLVLDGRLRHPLDPLQ